ncbi:5-carboxymethyl-2-hydroxymuconate Delta-isomerase [Lacibacterium aquatile]|uniref:5-carboxymethyl-2-hydroxymuconate Delta-isomerase n=1 Tax=Lacibacterium aquatile TaxID=1168082 RepID=A0ABW5DMH5_9PROT
MPQIRIEATPSLLQRIDVQPILAEIHEAVVATCPPAKLADCKSRVYGLTATRQGDGTTPSAMFHVDLKLIAGRAVEVRQEIGTNILAILDKHIGPHAKGLTIQTSVEVMEMPRETFFKSVHG